jgi:DNA-binding phage protein
MALTTEMLHLSTYISQRMHDLSIYADTYNLTDDEYVQSLLSSTTSETASLPVKNSNIKLFVATNATVNFMLMKILTTSKEVDGFFARIIQTKDAATISDVILLVCRMFNIANRPSVPTKAYLALEWILKLSPPEPIVGAKRQLDQIEDCTETRSSDSEKSVTVSVKRSRTIAKRVTAIDKCEAESGFSLY